MRKGVLLVGLGNIGLKYDLHLEEGSFVHTHARAFERHKEFILLGAVDDNLECRDVFTKIYEKPAYIDLFEALQVHKPDLVVIATPTSSHFKILSNILKKSSPRIILCEKPLSNNLIEAQKMVNECDKRDIDLFVNYMRRSDAGVIKVKNLIDSENFKIDLKGVAWYSKGFIHNGSHFFNLLEYWLGPMKNFNVLNIGRTTLLDDHEPDVEVTFKHGKIVFLAAWEEYFSHYTIELLSQSGRVRYEEEGHSISIQNIVSDPIFKDYKILNKNKKNIRANLQYSQLNVVNQLAKFISGESYNLCSGKEALVTLTSMQLIIAQLKK